YTLLILFRNILTGLRDVPEEAREAARGMGLTPAQSLWRVELPLALPAIVAGLRVATVTVISLATVAAFVIDKGLGAPIFAALQTSFKTEFIASGVLAVALALPPILTNAYVSVAGIDPEAREAARGMGMRPRQVFASIEFPLALPLLFAGIRTASVYVVATATLAAIAGGGGLGEIIVDQA